MAEENKYNILIEAGADFVLPWYWYDSNGNPVNLTGATIEGQLRHFAEDTSFVEFVCTHNGAGGRITITLPNEITGNLAWTSGVYDVFVTPAGGLRTKLLEGQAEIHHNVTKPVDGTFLYMVGIATWNDLPAVGNTSRLYFTYDERRIYRWNGQNYIATATGNGIRSIAFVQHVDEFSDKYRITYDDSTTFEYIVTSKGIDYIEKVGSTGTVRTGIIDQYRIHFNNNTTHDYYVTNGRTFNVKSYDSTLGYSTMDMVKVDGATYVAIQDVPANTAISNTSYWLKIIAPFTLGTVQSVGYDADPEITITGTADAPVINFKVPRGIPGNESINDMKGEGDTDYVWSADRSYKEIAYLKGDISVDRGNEIIHLSKQTVSGTGYIYKTYNIPMLPSTRYILSAEKIEGATAGSPLSVRIYNSSDTELSNKLAKHISSGEWYLEFTSPAETAYAKLYLYPATSGTVSATYYNVKVTKIFDILKLNSPVFSTIEAPYNIVKLDASQFYRTGRSNGTQENRFTSRALTKYKLCYPYDITLSIESGYRFVVIYFNSDGTFANDSGWKTTNYKVLANKIFEIQITKSPEVESETIDVATLVSKLSIISEGYEAKTIINNYAKGNYSALSGYRSTILSSTNLNEYRSKDIFFSADQVKMSSSADNYTGIQINIQSFRGNYISIKATRDVGNAYLYKIYFYDSSNTSTLVNNNESIIPEGTVRINVVLAACWGTALGSGTVVTYSDIEISISEKEKGNALYTGKKINLLNNEDRHICQMTKWKNFLSSEIEDLVDYNLHNNQSMAIYKDYVFLFNDGGTGVVVDYSTKEILSTFTCTPTSNHMNSAQFTDLYFDNADEFPILIISRCASYLQTPDCEEALFYRIARNGNDFTLTLINTAYFYNTVWYESSWGYDPINRTLIQCTYTNGSYSVVENNNIIYRVFTMPSVDSIRSGEAIVLNSNDIIKKFTLDHFILQGLTVHNSRIYQALQIDGNSQTEQFWVINYMTGEVESKVVLFDYKEPEGIAVYNSKIYVSQRTSSSSSTNPLWIAEVNFE